jgi:hypothetical protein
MELNSTILILLITLIVLLVVTATLYFVTRYINRLGKRRQAQKYRNRAALLPLANPTGSAMSMKPSLSFDGGESFRQSFYRSLTSKSSSTTLLVPEIRITFPDEEEPPVNAKVPGQRMSRVVVVQVGESGPAYVTPPPAYDGFQDVDVEALGGLKEKR